MRMHRRHITLAIFSALVLLLLSHHTIAWAQDDAGNRSRYIILLEDKPVATYAGEIPGLAATTPAITKAPRLDVKSPASRAYYEYLARQQKALHQLLQKQLGREVTIEAAYRWALNGIVIQLTPAEAEAVRKLPGVKDVVKDQERELLTDHGPQWIGAPTMWGSSTGCASGGYCGEGIIIGILDTGINHNHPSFAATGEDGYTHTNPYGSGNYKGICVDTPNLCNDKLIGIYDYSGGDGEDDNGHGSHTASIAAGNFISATLEAPTTSLHVDISGVAPHANIIAFKVCPGSCPTSYAVSAVEDAINDGVDVINYSIGGWPYYSPWSSSNLDAQAFLNARAAGIFVAVAGGNSGPYSGTIYSPAISPWVAASGASTHNRAFSNKLINMNTDAGTTLPDIDGRSVTSGYGPANIVYAGDYDNNNMCKSGIWASNTFNGEIVVCDRGDIARTDKSANVSAAGGGGMILANDVINAASMAADSHSIPSIHISYDDGVALKNWLQNAESGHTATISGTVMAVDSSYADIMASFSSRGPNSSVATQKVIKPDVVSPGMNIVAAVKTDSSLTPPEVGIKSGTSMAAPHLAGAAALLMQAHPTWTPAEIQSALMSTASTQNLYKEDGSTPVIPFDAGAGRIDLSVASDAGFLLDVTQAEYENADPNNGGDPSSLNIPSLATDELNYSWTFTRTLKSTQTGAWNVNVSATTGLTITVEPSSFSFSNINETQQISVTVQENGLTPDQWTFAQIKFTDTTGNAPASHFPLAVKCPSSPTALSVDIALSADDILLSWRKNGARYEVWRSQTPYFTPGDSTSQQLADNDYTATTFTDDDAGDGSANYYYKEVSHNTCNGTSTESANHVAIFSYTLTTGSP